MKSPLFVLFITLYIPLPLSAQDFPMPSGWSSHSEILSFTRDNLWEHINGAADQYLDLGFQDLQIQDFQKDSLAVSIEIYNMASDLNAFGIFALERPVPFEPLAIGSQGVLSLPGQALLFKNIYYVKIYAFEGELTETSAKMLLHGIADYLPGHSQFPKEFQTLPVLGRKMNSEGFAREVFLGLNELQNCLYAIYEDESGTQYRLFRIVTGSYPKSEEFFLNLSENWIGKDIYSYPARMITIPYQGMAAVVLTDQGLYGVSDCRDEAEIIKRMTFLKNSP